jgi:hypothetical protein
MDITRRALLPAISLAAGVPGVQIAAAALPLRVVATADGPYVSRVVDLGAAGQPGEPRVFEAHNRNRYIWEVG